MSRPTQPTSRPDSRFNYPFTSLKTEHHPSPAPPPIPTFTPHNQRIPTTTESKPTRIPPHQYDPMIHGQRPMPSPPPSRSAPSNPDAYGGFTKHNVNASGSGNLMAGGSGVSNAPLAHDFAYQSKHQAHPMLVGGSIGQAPPLPPPPPPPGSFDPSNPSYGMYLPPPTAMSVLSGHNEPPSRAMVNMGSSTSTSTSSPAFTSRPSGMLNATRPSTTASSSTAGFPPSRDGAESSRSNVNDLDSMHLPIGVSGGKLFKCMGFDGCEMTFTRSEHLARHVRKHTGERPFPCHCGKSFSRLDNLRQHSATVHSDQSDLNERMLRSLAPVHAALSQRAGRDQKRRGEILELPKSSQTKSKTSVPEPASATSTTMTSSSRPSSGPTDTSGKPGPIRIKKSGHTKNSRSQSGMSPLGVLMRPPGAVSGSDPALRSAPVNGRSPFPPPFSSSADEKWVGQRPPSAGITRPSSSSDRQRPLTSATRPNDPRPTTGLSASLSASYPSGREESNDAAGPGLRAGPPPSFQNPFPYGFPAHSETPQLPNQDSRHRPDQANVISQIYGGQQPVLPPTAASISTSYSDIPGRDVWTSTASSATAPDTAYSQVVYVPPVLDPQAAAGGQFPYNQTTGIPGPATQAQIQQIYGNGAGQDDPFSYHPPPTAASITGGSYGPHSSSGSSYAFGQPQYSGYGFEPAQAQPAYGLPFDQRGAGSEGFRKGKAFEISHSNNTINGDRQLGALARNQGRGVSNAFVGSDRASGGNAAFTGRRSSLAIASLLSDDPNQAKSGQTSERDRLQNQDFYSIAPPRQAMQAFSFGGYDPESMNEADPGFYQSQTNYAGPSQDNSSNSLGSQNLGWGSNRQQELVGAMEAKAKALLGEQYGL